MFLFLFLIQALNSVSSLVNFIFYESYKTIDIEDVLKYDTARFNSNNHPPRPDDYGEVYYLQCFTINTIYIL